MRNAIILAALVTASAMQSAGGTTRYVDASVAESGDGSSWQAAFKKIKEAINAASEGDTVIVAEGTYLECLFIWDKNIVLTSTDPGDPAVVGGTIIDGNQWDSVVRFYGAVDPNCVLSGFTITNGEGGCGGGIEGNATLATITNNIIRGNTALGSDLGYAQGAGLFQCNGLIEDNIISDNTAGQQDVTGIGAGLSECGGTIRGNIIVRNRAWGWTCDPDWPWSCDPPIGGGLYGCNGTIENNLIADNISEGMGGGLAYCDGVVRGNTIARNVGSGLWECSGTILANAVYANSGSGLNGCAGLIANNLIYRNSYYGVFEGAAAVGNNLIWANSSGGLTGRYHLLVQNCIIWGNGGAQLEDYLVDPRYSCIQDWTGGGEGNISEEPRFVDAEKGDFRLLPDSPCIDAGFNDPQLPEMDIAGMHRVMFGGKSLTVDMGAYEFYINALARGPNPDQTTFTWSSLADKTYSIFYTDDLLTWRLALESFPSSGNQTTFWIDDGSLSGLPPSLSRIRFYRLLENP